MHKFGRSSVQIVFMLWKDCLFTDPAWCSLFAILKSCLLIVICLHPVAGWRSTLVSMNEVNLRRARLVLRWVTVSGFNSRCQSFISICNQRPRPTQPSILPGSVNKDQLKLGGQRQVWFIPLADERGENRCLENTCHTRAP